MGTIINKILQKKGSNTDVAVAFICRDNRLLIGLRNYTVDTWKDISPSSHLPPGAVQTEISFHVSTV